MNQCRGWFVGLFVRLLLVFPFTLNAGPPVADYLSVRNGLPQGSVTSLIQDRRGFIWLATRDGLCRYDGVRMRIYAHDPAQPHSLAFSSISELKADKQGLIWVRTENNQIDCFNPVTEQTRHVSDSPAFRRARGRSPLVGIYPDRSGHVWVATQTNGFFRLDTNGNVSHRHWAPLSDSTQIPIRALLLDRNDQLWLATRVGLFRYTLNTDRFTGFRTAEGLPQNDVFSLYERVNGELLLGFPGRFARFNPATGRVSQVIPLPDRLNQPPLFARNSRGVDYINQHTYSDSTGLVTLPADPKLARFAALSLLVDRSNVLWIGLDGDGVIKYDLKQRPFLALPYTTNFQTDWITQQLRIPVNALPDAVRRQRPNTLRYQFDRQKNLWIGSAVLPPYRYDSNRRLFEAVRPTGIESRWLPDGNLRLTTLSKGPSGEVWGLLGPDNRVVARYNPGLQTFTAFPLPLPVNHPYTIMAMVVDGGRIYLATQGHGLLRADLPSKRLIRWRANATQPGALPNNNLLCLAQDPKQYNHLWIGTHGSGLCRLDKLTGQIRCFTSSQGLPNNVIYAIRPDNQGHLWLSTNRGLCRFDNRTFEISNYTTDDGLPSEEFSSYYDAALPDGRLVFGGISGYTAFDPSRVSEDPFKPTVALTALHINNRLVSPSGPDSPIRQDINYTKELRLNHEQNFLSFDFAALEFNRSSKNQYRYKLTGLDDDWVYSGNQSTATYTNLPPGSYSFVVNATNTSGVWSPYTRTLNIIIDPPLWATWWAYAAYVLLLLGAIFLFLRVRINRIRLKSQMELREQESTQLKLLDEVKTRFFSNITHELRTPLTLILTPLDQLEKEITDPQQQNRLSLVHRNANRLLRLINELLDLAKLEAGTLAVNTSPGDLVEFVSRIVLFFENEAQRKQIELRMQSLLTQAHYWFDADKLDKILNNLLANALKFTGEKGFIEVVLTPLPTGTIRFVVRDTGNGIPAESLPYVFNRFYQVGTVTDQPVAGSGIGLSLAKELVELMQGTISVDSIPSVGTTFTVDLPLQPAAAESVPTKLMPDVAGPLQHSSAEKAAMQAESQDYDLLIVEDNDDIADYLVSILGIHWRVRRVTDGQAGVEAALTDLPDLIVSDVLMPNLDGLELCRQLKSNSITSHIPILLLTAKVAIESRLDGFNAGADDYIAKPFQIDELLGRIRNRLAHQEQLRQHHRKVLLREGHVPNASATASPEDEFVNRIYALVEERLDDTTLSVESMARFMGISRMHLNRKLKALTGLTPNELIRVVRLNRAADLLLTGVSISEVADRVGFDTAAYFSKVFKEHHHLTPSEYIDKQKQEVV